MMLSFMFTSTPNFFKISIKYSSPCGKSLIVASICKLFPIRTEADRSNARLEKSDGIVTEVELYT